MKRVIGICLLALIAVGSSHAGTYGGGNGTSEEPYEIWTAEQMNAIGTDPNDLDKHFKLMADINLSAYTGTSYNIIGSSDKPFRGVFDGNGYTVSNFTYSSTVATEDIGLFGFVEGAEIKNLGVINPNIYFEIAATIGALVGWTGEEGVTISNCYVEGGIISVVNFGDCIGGLAGLVQGEGVVANCHSSATVLIADGSAGGLIGSIYRSTVSHCYSTGNVSGLDHVGGLVGRGGSPTHKITNCYATGSVSGTARVGGLIGINYDISIFNCYSTGSVSGTTDVGGLAGTGDPNLVFNSYWDTQTSGRSTSSGGTPKTTALMKDVTTYTWWGCNGEWTINDGVDYPHLAWENMPGEIITDPFYSYGGGSGTENDPYRIYTSEQLNTIGQVVCDWNAHFKLMADIDLSGYTGTAFSIVGNRGLGFDGVFDGNGHIISNFSYNSSGENGIGLFRYLGGDGNISNVIMSDPNVSGGTGNEVGSLAGTNTGAITNCRAIGTIVSGSESVGGLVGLNTVFGTVTVCRADGVTVSGTRDIGGLVGLNGVRHWHSSMIVNCCSTGSVSGENNIGGLVGRNGVGTVTQSYSSATVSGYGFNAGGLVGWNDANINDCYATGSVIGNAQVGGLAGIFYGMVSNCYSTGRVSGNTDVGGLMGWTSGSGKVFDSFWDEGTSNQTTSAGGTGFSTALMQMQVIFTAHGWDFVGESTNGTNDIWRMCVDDLYYPHLFHQYNVNGDFTCPDGVGMDDLIALCQNWLNSEELDPGFNYPCDPTFDGVTNLPDFGILSEHWLE